MKKAGKAAWIIGLFLLVLALLVAGLIALPAFIKPDFLQGFIVRTVREHSAFDISLEQPEFNLFPSPSFRFQNVQLRQKSQLSQSPFLSIDDFRCSLRALPLLARQIEFAKVVLKGTDMEWPVPGDTAGLRTLKIQDGLLVVENIKSNDWVKFNLAGKWLDDKPNLFADGRVKLDFNHPDFHQMALNATIKLNDLPISKMLQWYDASADQESVRGILEWNGKIGKEERSQDIVYQGLLNASEFVYQYGGDHPVASTPADYALDVETVFNLATRQLVLKRMDVTAPYMSMAGKGMVDFAARKMENLRFSTNAVQLDHLPAHLLPLAQVLPVNFGFSGEGKVELGADGPWEALKMNLSIDFTKALLSFARFFEKPKSIPLTLQATDLSLKSGARLEGQVGIDFDQARFKLSIAQLDLTSGVGEMTLLTNRFPLNGWEKFVPPLADYQFSGGFKCFVSGKGDFKKPETARLMYNVSFDHVGVLAKSGDPLIQDLEGAVDVGPINLETNGLAFQLGNSYMALEAKMFFQEVPRLVFHAFSPELDPRNFASALRPLARAFNWTAADAGLEQVQGALAQALRPGTKLEDFQTEINYENNRLVMKNLAFNLYGGAARASGWLDVSEEKPVYAFDLEFDHVSLARMTGDDGTKVADGNLFLASHLEGTGFSPEDLTSRLKGEGVFSVTNGELYTVNILGSLASIAQFAGLGQVPETTRFHDMNSRFVVSNGKIKTDHIFLYSDDLYVDAAGEIDLEGNLNFRLQAALSEKLSRRISSKVNPGDRLGPIPFLLTGKLAHPDLKPDPALIQELILNIAQQHFDKIVPIQNWFQVQKPISQEKASLEKALEPSTPNSKDARRNIEEKAIQTGMTLLESLFEKRT